MNNYSMEFCDLFFLKAPKKKFSRTSSKIPRATKYQLIYSCLVDPQSRPVVIIIFARVACPSVLPFVSLSVNTSVPTFQSLAKQNKLQTITTGRAVGLAEWIIDDVLLLLLPLVHLYKLLPIHLDDCKHEKSTNGHF